jgi:hypothetical protein
MAERARSTRAWWKSKPWLHLHTSIAQSAILIIYLSTWIAPKVLLLKDYMLLYLAETFKLLAKLYSYRR